MKMSYRKGYKYQLFPIDYIMQTDVHPEHDIQTKFIDLNKEGLLRIKSGYSWDGASGPTIDTKSSMRGALVHDALYQLMRLELLHLEWRIVADAMLRDICIEDGMFKWRARLWHWAVRHGALKSATAEGKRKTLQAP